MPKIIQCACLNAMFENWGQEAHIKPGQNHHLHAANGALKQCVEQNGPIPFLGKFQNEVER